MKGRISKPKQDQIMSNRIVLSNIFGILSFLISFSHLMKPLQGVSVYFAISVSLNIGLASGVGFFCIFSKLFTYSKWKLKAIVVDIVWLALFFNSIHVGVREISDSNIITPNVVSMFISSSLCVSFVFGLFAGYTRRISDSLRENKAEKPIT